MEKVKQQLRWDEETNECFIDTLEDGELTTVKISTEEYCLLKAKQGY